MGGGSSKPDPAISRRLIIYSELTTQLPGFTDVMKAIAPAVVGWQYCFAGPKATDADQFVAQLSKLVKQYTQGRGFESIALITHGPKPPAPPPEGEDCLWELSGRIVLTDPSHLLRDSHAVNQVMRVLGGSTTRGGRVDLLTCGVLNTWACPEHKFPQLMPFASIEESTSSTFVASTHLLDLETWSSDDGWPMDSDNSVDIKASYFLPPTGAAAAPGLLKVSELHRKWKLGRVLGRGQFAVVHHATLRAPPADPVAMAAAKGAPPALTVQLSSDVPREGVAIKVIDKARCEATIEEIECEVTIMQMVTHPHILRLYESFDSPKRLYMVLELATGGELFDRIVERGTYSEADAALVIRQLGDALQHIHSLDVVHSDLKPSNLILASPAEDAPLKVADFGLASIVMGPSTHASNSLVGSHVGWPLIACRWALIAC